MIDDRLLEYDRAMLNRAFVSLFWSVIADKREGEGFDQQTLVSRIGINKAAYSRWFSWRGPNWSINTISDIAHALNLDVQITARDRTTGVLFTPQGKVVKPKPKRDSRGRFMGRGL